MGRLSGRMRYQPVGEQTMSMPVPVLNDIAHQLFHRALRAARLRRLWATLRGGSTELPACTELLARALPLVQPASGVEHVRLDQIVGSEGRAEDFDQQFAPLKQHIGARWQPVAVSWMGGLSLPPVRLLQLGTVYIVRDGHHRISVARTFGATTIESVVEQRYVLNSRI